MERPANQGLALRGLYIYIYIYMVKSHIQTRPSGFMIEVKGNCVMVNNKLRNLLFLMVLSSGVPKMAGPPAVELR